MIERPATAPRPVARRGRHIGPIPITAVNVLIFVALVGSGLFLVYVVAAIRENQIPMMASGFAVMGAAFVAMAVSSLVAMWRAASRARGGRALGLAIFGGLAGLAAIGCFTITALAAMVWNT